jgi:peroxiredoxin
LTLPVRGVADTIRSSISISEEASVPLKVGDMAPDFEVPAVTGKDKSKLKLSDFRGKQNVVIAFYPLDWTPV